MSAQTGFELRDGDRVVFVGSTFIERDQVCCYLETMLTARWPDRNITFRNLGWSGDTVWGEARARFGTAADGFQHLKEHTESIKPTVIFVAYGTNESFAGDAGLSDFESGLNKLLDMLSAASSPQVRIILVAPLYQENLGPPLPDPAAHNEDIKRYAETIRKVGHERMLQVLDLMDKPVAGAQISAAAALTDNGIHLTGYGYWRVAGRIIDRLGVGTKSCSLVIGQDGKLSDTRGLRISAFEKTPHGVRFTATAEYLPRPAPPSPVQKNPSRIELDECDGCFFQIEGMQPGKYALRVDGDAGKIHTAKVPVIEYESQRIEQLRQAIIEKNRLYFHRWRPQNETYLFGFRKHEQGQNAAEVPKFDPLVEEQEKLIAKLRVPLNHTYELVMQAD